MVIMNNLRFGFIDFYHILGSKKGRQVVKSTSSVWFGSHGALYYSIRY